MTATPVRCLLIVDVQYDFLAGGPLAVPDGDAVIPVITELQGAFDLVVATQDWHPATHRSFAINRPEVTACAPPAAAESLETLWPTHCVQSSHGAEIAAQIRAGRISRVIRKGTDIHIDSYSAFFDNAHQSDTGLNSLLDHNGVRQVFICGLATDFCVKFTALDAVALGYSTFVILDACRGIDPGSTADALAAMKTAGVILVQSNDVCQPSKSSS